MAELTDEQRAILNSVLERRSAREASRERAPRERTRAALQGLTLGFSDEMEAALRAPFSGQTYDEILDELRARLAGYKEARPLEALGYEAAGVVAPAIGALVAAPFTGGSSAAGVAPTLGRLAGRAALEGGAYAFGTGENGLAERATRIPGGALGGAVTGTVGGVAMRAAGGAFSTLTDSVRRIVGNRGSSIVENEIQRLARQTGKSAEELSDDILNGRIIAENDTIKAAVKAYRSGGGEASTTMTEALKARPAATRSKAMAALRGGLSSGSDDTAIAAWKKSDEALAAAESAAYSQFDDMAAPDDVVEGLMDALRRVPSAADEVTTALRAQTGSAPFFEIAEDGSVAFTRAPTVKEAEVVRRAMANRASALYKGSAGTAGQAVKGAESEFRSILDLSVDGLSDVRAQAAALRANRDAFDAGRKALVGDVNETLLNFSKIADPEEVQAYRAGLMAALEARAATGSRQSMIRNLANPEAREGMILREVFPQDQLDEAIQAIDTASGAQRAADYILGGSPTTETAVELARQGMGISVSDITGVMSFSPDAMLNVASKLANKFTRALTDAERTRVARMLVSEDPEMVRLAIIDEGAMAALQKRVEQIASQLTKAVSRAGAVEGGGAVANYTSGLLSQQ